MTKDCFKLSMVNKTSKRACHLLRARCYPCRLTTCILRKRRCHLLYNLLLLLLYLIMMQLLLLGLPSRKSSYIMCDICVICCSRSSNRRWLIHKHFHKKIKELLLFEYSICLRNNLYYNLFKSESFNIHLNQLLMIKIGRAHV